MVMSHSFFKCSATSLTSNVFPPLCLEISFELLITLLRKLSANSVIATTTSPCTVVVLCVGVLLCRIRVWYLVTLEWNLLSQVLRYIQVVLRE
jgi:hypothetical protein